MENREKCGNCVWHIPGKDDCEYEDCEMWGDCTECIEDGGSCHDEDV